MHTAHLHASRISNAKVRHITIAPDLVAAYTNRWNLQCGHQDMINDMIANNKALTLEGCCAVEAHSAHMSLDAQVLSAEEELITMLCQEDARR